MLYTIYLLSVWLHILAAITWVGGMFTLLLVVVPWLRRGDRAQAAAMLRDMGPRLRDIGWICFGLLAITGTFNLWARGVRLSSFGSAAWLASPFGRAVLWKLGVFGVILGVSAAHDFILGPRATVAVLANPQSAQAQRMRRGASYLGRLNALLALLIVALAVTLVRGLPF